MTMKIKFFFVMMLASLSCKAQFPSFMIDTWFGDVQVIKPGKKAVTVKSRIFLYDNDILVIKKNGGKVTLVNKEYQYSSIDKKGSYKIADLAKLTVAKSNSITEKYFELIWEELLNPGVFSAKEHINKIAGSYGGIIRGTCKNNEMPAENTSTADTWITFSWSPLPGLKKYRFSLYNQSDELLYQFIINDTAFTINSRNFVTNEPNSYYWEVEAEESPDQKTCKSKLNWLSAEEYKKQTEALNNLVDKSKPYYLLEISNKFFENGFYKLSADYFRRAVEEQN